MKRLGSWVGFGENCFDFRFPGRLLRVLWTAVGSFLRNNRSLRAITLTYNTLFAIVPAAALTFGIAKGFDLDLRLQELLLDNFSRHTELVKWIYGFAEKLLNQTRGSVVAGTGVVVLLITVMMLAGNIEKAFNSIWGLPPRGNIIRRFGDYLGILLMMPILLVVMSSAGVFIRSGCEKLIAVFPTLNSGMQLAAQFFVLLPMLLLIAVFTLVYQFTPNTRVRFLSALLGGIIAGILFLLLQDSFIFLQKAIFRYNRIYGSFSALPLFLIWMQWSWLIALFGAEVAFVDQHLAIGMFDRQAEELMSPRLCSCYELAVAALICRRFSNGGGSYRTEELVETLKISPVMTERLLSELLRAGIIIRTAENNGSSASYLPALPPDQLTIGSTLNRLRHCGQDEPVYDSAQRIKPLSERLLALEKCAAAAPENILLKELEF